jgi:hypothetical protein
MLTGPQLAQLGNTSVMENDALECGAFGQYALNTKRDSKYEYKIGLDINISED